MACSFVHVVAGLSAAGALLIAAGGCQPPPTLASVQQTVFTPRCANGACHSGPNPPVDLDLSEGNAYANIVDVPAAAVSDATRLVPGSPELSLVFLVTEEAQGAVRRMPIGGELDPAEADLLRQWIEDGAPQE